MGALEHGLSRYFSVADLAALRTAHVGIVGAGGLGSNVAMMLARSGIRNFVMADPDVVDASNLNRQSYFPEDVGISKVLSLSRYLTALEPAINFVAHELTVTRENAVSLFDVCPIVVEAVDNAETKVFLYELFAPEKELYVTASGVAGFGDDAMMIRRNPRPNVIAVGDFSRAVGTANPPLAPRVMQAAAMQADAVLAHILSVTRVGE